jgi:excisionase family DNA binding protein
MAGDRLSDAHSSMGHASVRPAAAGGSTIGKDADTLSRLPTLMTVDELARLLRVNRKTAYDAVAKGEIPGARRVGRTIRITRDVVVGWLRGQGHVSRSSGGK